MTGTHAELGASGWGLWSKMIRVRIDYHRKDDVKDGKPWHLTINGVLYNKFRSKGIARQAMWDIDSPTATAFLEETEK